MYVCMYACVYVSTYVIICRFVCTDVSYLVHMHVRSRTPPPKKGIDFWMFASWLLYRTPPPDPQEYNVEVSSWKLGGPEKINIVLWGEGLGLEEGSGQPLVVLSALL